jgi:rhodanese-related sulfurtransferase
MAKRITPQQAQPRIESGDAIFVCAYDGDEKFPQNHLQGAISLDDFQSRAGSIPKEREIIFYCA